MTTIHDHDIAQELTADAQATARAAFDAAWHIVAGQTSGAFLRDLGGVVHLSLPASTDRPKRVELVVTVADLPAIEAAAAMLRAKGRR